MHRRGASWRYVIDLGPDPATGRRRQAQKAGFRTRKEAEGAMRVVSVAADEGGLVPKDRRTLGAYLDEWLETIRPRLRGTTWSSYEVAVNRVKEYLGAVRLQALTPMEVESLYAKLAEEGRADGRPLAPKSVRNTHVALRRALADAERLGLVVRNVAASARPPSAPRAEQQTWSSDDLREFFEAAKADRLAMAYTLLATTGMRRGEVIGLRWRDVDFDDQSLSIVQTITTVKSKLVVSPPKTAKSRRQIALDETTIEGLRAHRRRQREERMAAGPSWNSECDLVFTDELGEPVHPDRLSRGFQWLLRRAGLPRIRLHDLRHSYATLALKAGVHPKVVSERLGHATVGITLDLYSHVSKGMDADAARLVAGQIFGERRAE